MRRTFVWLPWILLVIVIAGFVVWQKAQTPPAPVAADGVKMPAEKTQPLVDTTRQGGVVSYSEAVKVAAPAVVNIFTTQKVQEVQHPLFSDPRFREFFGDQFGDQMLQGRPENSLGSGVIVRADGYILTNNHVIEKADQIVVALHDGRRAEAKVVGTDPETDLAVIKIELDKLPVLPFKLSGNEVGDVVLAIGNPFGVGQTVTQGIISATERSNLGINTYEDFIQTDAAINPGNSGGALIDVAGNLIGINTAIFSRTGGSMGIGFAIPAQICQYVLNGILKDGRVIRGRVGLQLMPNSQEMTLEPTKGALVVQVDDGPAKEAGIKSGDVIVQVDKLKVTNTNQLINYVAAQAPGTKINVQAERDGKALSFNVQVAERPTANQRQGQFVPLPR